MKAMLLRRPAPIESRPLAWTEVAPPAPGHDELLVRVRTCGICRTDLHEVEGDLPMAVGAGATVIPGHQIVGVVEACGPGASGHRVGDRVGVAWLHRACGSCSFCTRRRENLCDRARFTGWHVNGGYAECMTVPAAFAYSLPDAFTDEAAAPLLCAGIIGYRALRLADIAEGGRLGLFGFGNAAHMAIQVARSRGCRVSVFTRTEGNRRLAAELGAVWVGGATDRNAPRLDAAVIFAPAGELVPWALERLEKGGTVVLAGIHMSPTPPLDYARHLYDEKIIRSVANATREDAREFLDTAARVGLQTHVQAYELAEANEALQALKHSEIAGAGVLRISA